MQNLGGGDKCPRCDRTVYFAEERRALGRKYHSACLKCVKCNKALDSTNCNDHEGDIYCNSCYRKEFGPQGYGFAAGAAGLGTDGGARATINTNASGNSSAGSAFGGGEKCPRCDKTVFMAEKVIGAGQAYHKQCFRCQSCSKALDSTILTQHEGDIYCKACYGRHFGPKGYGYAMGAAGLTMDTGRADEICTQNISHLAQAQVPMSNGGDPGNNEICARCAGPVFFAERVTGMGKVYHRACFKCTTCNKNLDSTLLTQHEEDIYCKDATQARQSAAEVTSCLPLWNASVPAETARLFSYVGPRLPRQRVKHLLRKKVWTQRVRLWCSHGPHRVKKKQQDARKGGG